MGLSAASPPPALVRSSSRPGRSDSRPEGAPLRVAVDTTPLVGVETGIGVMTRELLERLAPAEDLAVTGYVVSWRARDRYRHILPSGVEPFRLRWPARLCHRTWQRLERPRLPSRFDVVHATNYVLPPVADAAGLVTIHDLTAWRYPEMVDRFSAAYPVLVQRAIERGASVHCVSRAVADEVIDELGVSAERVSVIANGHRPVIKGRAEAGRRKAGGRYVVTIGTVEPRKDYVGLVAAMTAVWDQHPELRLVIAGADGWGAEQLTAAASRADAGDRLIRCGYVSAEDKADLLAGAELFVFPSVYEGFGLPVLEAMDAGLPVVTTSAGALPEVVGDAAVLVPPQVPEALAEAILSVLENDDVRRRLIDEGSRRVEAFSWDRMADEMAGLYQRLADSS